MLKRTLLVQSNIWSQTDHEGRPCGVYARFDKVEQFIGAKQKVTATDARGNAITSETQYVAPSFPIYDVEWEETDDVVTVEYDRYYLDGIKQGALIPADENTAKLAGVEFKPVIDVRAATKAKAQGQSN